MKNQNSGNENLTVLKQKLITYPCKISGAKYGGVPHQSVAKRLPSQISERLKSEIFGCP